MLLDKENLFSNAQTINTTTFSEDYIDLGAHEDENQKYHYKGEIAVFAQVVRAFVGGNGFAVQLITSDDPNFGSYDVLHQTAALNTAQLIAGYQFRFSRLPSAVKRYVGLNYMSDEETDGAITAGLVFDVQTSGMTDYQGL